MSDNKYTDYYNGRKQLRQLYTDKNINGALISSILQIRDRNRNISTINIDMDNYCIDVEMVDDIEHKKVSGVAKKINTMIGNYIDENKDKLSIGNNIIDNIFKSKYNLFSDTIIVGSSIRVNL